MVEDMENFYSFKISDDLIKEIYIFLSDRPTNKEFRFITVEKIKIYY
jgi:hypothetical protein